MGYTAAQAKSFIQYIAPMIQTEAHSRGYPICSTVIAQAIIEGAAGTSSLAKNYHNHFGLKCGSKWKGTSVNMKTKEEYSPGTLTTIKDNFRAYPDDASGVSGYYDFINTSRYANLKTATTAQQYAEMLKADGYATSSSYVSTLMSVVNKYDLTQYDGGYVPIPAQTDVDDILTPTLRKGDRNEYVRAWQTFLNINGYGCGNADGIFGDKTQAAVIKWQQDHGIEAGYIGQQTWNTIK